MALFRAAMMAPALPDRPGAPVAELVDAADSKSVARKGVLVRVRPGAPIKTISYVFATKRTGRPLKILVGNG